MLIYQDGNIRQHDVTCENCKKEWVIVSELKPGFSDYEDVYCPECGNFLGEFRADVGWRISKKEG